MYLLHLCLNKKGPDSCFWSAHHCTFCHVCLAHISLQSLFDSDHSDLCTPMQTGFREDRNTWPLPSMWQSGPLQLLVQKPSLILLTLLLRISWNFFRSQHSHPSGRQLGLPGVADTALCPWLSDCNGHYQMHLQQSPTEAATLGSRSVGAHRDVPQSCGVSNYWCLRPSFTPFVTDLGAPTPQAWLQFLAQYPLMLVLPVAAIYSW